MNNCHWTAAGFLSGFLVQSVSVAVKLLYVEVFSTCQDKFVLTSDFFQDTASEIRYRVSWSVDEVVSSRFCQHSSLYVVPVFSHSILERARRFSYIFTIRKHRTVVLNALPIVNYIIVLAGHIVLDVVTVTCYLSYYLCGWFQAVGADRTLFPVAGTFLPARSGTAGSGWSCTGHWVESSSAEESSQVGTLAEGSHGRGGENIF